MDDNLLKHCENLRNFYISDLDEGLYDECVQFKYFMDAINAEIREEYKKFLERQSKKKKNTELHHEDGDDDNEDDGERISKSAMMLRFIRKHCIEPTFPNIEKALRILETIAICNASGERSFNALKRVERYGRSTLSQIQLNYLTLIFINHDLLNDLDFDSVIDILAAMKARKVHI